MNSVSDLIVASGERVACRCETHGDYESRHVFGTIWTKCPICSSIKNAEEKAARETQEREEKRVRWQTRMGDAGIPERFQDRALDNFVASNEGQAKALKFAQEYAADFHAIAKTGRSAVFIGLPGTGKTHLAIGIGMDAMRKGYTVLFTTVMRAIRRVKDTWNKGSNESETSAIDSLIYPDLLILDEVGVQFGSETEKMILFDVLNGRYEKRRPTLLLSNLTLDEVKAFLGERIFDRLREDGGHVQAFTWESYRGRK